MRPDEIERMEQVLNGKTVVANVRQVKGVGVDADLIEWAKDMEILVDISRNGPWGNPAIMGRESDREKVCEYFKQHLANRPDLLERIRAGELSGKVLACWCHPKRCHGHHLAELANCAELVG